MRLLITGGGTGGHIFPAVNTAKAFMDISPEHRVLFVNTGKELDYRLIKDKGYDMEVISVLPLKGKKKKEILKSLLLLPFSLLKALKILYKFKPRVVLAVGGYSSVPCALAAFFLRVPLILHEQNKVSGLAGKLLSYMAREIHISFPETRISAKKDKIRLTGNPVNISAKAPGFKKREKNSPLKLLVLGGSQGARSINQLIIKILPELESRDIEISHQSGKKDFAMVKKAYENYRGKAELSDFIDNMEEAYKNADLVLCRAGAGTIAELANSGLASILIPYPYSSDKHQHHNARVLADAGAAILIEEKDIKAEDLLKLLDKHIENPELTEEMSKKALKHSYPEADKKLANALMAYI